MDIDWQPSADIKILKRRAQYIADVRHFFAQRAVWEVETPILSPTAPTAPYLESFTTAAMPIGENVSKTYYLQTSPEFAMKRLLAVGSGSIYQISTVFRKGEQGRLHSPEFTMLEWYRPELSLIQLMDEVEVLTREVFNFKPALRMSYYQLFIDYLQLDLDQCSDDDLAQNTAKNIPSLAADFVTDRDGYLGLLMSYIIEPKLAALNVPVFVYDFPARQAQLAKIKVDASGAQRAARFELYSQGVELANGYDELLDADELRQRFEFDNRQRQQNNKAIIPLDEHLLAAMDSGLPDCSGVALGIDRIIMLAMNKSCLADVRYI